MTELWEVLDVDGCVEHLPTEPFDVPARNPGSTEAGGDLCGFELAGQDPFQCGHVGSEAPVGVVGGSTDSELRPYVARQVLTGGHESTGVGFVVDQLAKLTSDGGGVGTEQFSSAPDGDRSSLVETNRDRFFRGVDAVSFTRWVDDPVMEDRRRTYLLGLLVEDLQRRDERPVGVFAEPTHSRTDPAHDLLAGLGVAPTGPGLARPIDRPVDADVAPVPLGEGGLSGGELVIVAAVDLHGEDGAGRVAEADESSQLAAVLGDARLVGDRVAAAEDGDLATLVHDEAAVVGVGQLEVPSSRARLGACRLDAGRRDIGEPLLACLANDRVERSRK
ncbi:MAG: hypothetical protein V9E99_05355 [Microthrixaceae bacterium]